MKQQKLSPSRKQIQKLKTFSTLFKQNQLHKTQIYLSSYFNIKNRIIYGQRNSPLQKQTNQIINLQMEITPSLNPQKIKPNITINSHTKTNRNTNKDVNSNNLNDFAPIYPTRSLMQLLKNKQQTKSSSSPHKNQIILLKQLKQAKQKLQKLQNIKSIKSINSMNKKNKKQKCFMPFNQKVYYKKRKSDFIKDFNINHFNTTKQNFNQYHNQNHQERQLSLTKSCKFDSKSNRIKTQQNSQPPKSQTLVLNTYNTKIISRSNKSLIQQKRHHQTNNFSFHTNLHPTPSLKQQPSPTKKPKKLQQIQILQFSKKYQKDLILIKYPQFPPMQHKRTKSYYLKTRFDSERFPVELKFQKKKIPEIKNNQIYSPWNIKQDFQQSYQMNEEELLLNNQNLNQQEDENSIIK